MAQKREREWPRPWDADEPAGPTDWVEQSKRMGTEAPWRQRERERERQEHRAHLLRFSAGVGILLAIIALHVGAGVLWGGEGVAATIVAFALLTLVVFVLWAIWTGTA